MHAEIDPKYSCTFNFGPNFGRIYITVPTRDKRNVFDKTDLFLEFGPKVQRYNLRFSSFRWMFPMFNATWAGSLAKFDKKSKKTKMIKVDFYNINFIWRRFILPGCYSQWWINWQGLKFPLLASASVVFITKHARPNFVQKMSFYIQCVRHSNDDVKKNMFWLKLKAVKQNAWNCL